MLKILHIRVDGLFAGTETILLEYLRRLDRSRFDSRLIALVNDGPLAERARNIDIPVDVVPMRSRFDSNAVSALGGLVEKHRPDVVLSYGIRANWLTWKLSPIRGARWISRVPNLIYNDYPNPIVGRGMYLLDRWMLREADAVIAAARLPQRVLSGGFLAAKKVEYVPNGVDFDLYSPDAKDSTFRDSLGIPENAKVLACIGRLEPVKGQEYLIEALPKIREGFPEIRVVLAGTGKTEESLKALAQTKACDDIIHFTGFMDDVKSVLGSTDLYVAPSLHEGMPSAVMEAIAMQVPVVATAVGGHLELMGQWAPDMLVPAKKPGTLATKVTEVLGHLLESEKKASLGREWLKENHSWDMVIPRLEELLGSCSM